MRIIQLGDKDYDITRYFISEAGKEAKKSICLRSNCGALIVKDEIIRGRGSNSPPGDEKIPYCFKEFLPKDFKSDKTCCIHAEKRAIDDCLYTFTRDVIKGSTLYFTRINGDKKIIPVDKPYCTMCSKDALDKGISKWVLFHQFGFVEYDAREYNEISFGFREWDIKKLL
jgi:deoxycytidylate deaminase